jgi:hypothetical protein
MAVLTGEQIGVLIYDNKKWGPGGSKSAVVKFLDTAIAVALAESGGNTDAKNPSSSASGLFQIMVSVHQDKIAGRDIFDPRVNIDVARLVWEAAGKSFSPWTTYTSGAYKSHLGFGPKVYDALEKAKSTHDFSFITAALSGIPVAGAGAAALSGLLPDGVTNPIDNAATKAAKLAGGIASDVMKWLASGFLVIGAALLAALLIIVGAWFLLSNTKVGKEIGADTKSAALMAATKGVVK